LLTLPWLTRDKTVTDPVTVMGSRFLLTSRRSVPAFMLASVSNYFQALRAPGVVGVALRVQPLRGEFWTLSSWRDRATLYDYAKTEPHRSSMRKFRTVTERADFAHWETAAQPTWQETEQRIADVVAGGGWS